jgi:hypothetical protein
MAITTVASYTDKNVDKYLCGVAGHAHIKSQFPSHRENDQQHKNLDWALKKKHKKTPPRSPDDHNISRIVVPNPELIVKEVVVEEK